MTTFLWYLRLKIRKKYFKVQGQKLKFHEVQGILKLRDTLIVMVSEKR